MAATIAVISYPRHIINNISLLLLCILVSPVIFTISALAYCYGKLCPRKTKKTETTPRAVLITSPERMTKSLTLCRAFHEAGYRVVAAEVTSPYAYEYSNSVSKYYCLPTADDPSYFQILSDIIRDEKVDLLVPVCGIGNTIEDVKAAVALEESSDCRMFQWDLDTGMLLDKKDYFIAKMEELGLMVPETHKFDSKESLLKFLEGKIDKGNKYILKCIGLDDTSRGRVPLLPLANMTATRDALENIPISDTNPFVLQEYIEGQEFATYSIITHGKVRVFGACKSSDLTMHYKPLPPKGGIAQAMLEFTERTVGSIGNENLAAQLSFDFIVPTPPYGVEYTDLRKDEVTLYPIECNPRTHTAVVMFQDKLEEIGTAYMSIFEDGESLKDWVIIEPTVSVRGRYWIGHDFFSFVLFPFLNLLVLKETPWGVLRKFVNFIDHLLYWDDGVLSRWDPLPFLILYTVHWPVIFLRSLLTGKRWTRVNISTSRVYDAHVK